MNRKERDAYLAMAEKQARESTELLSQAEKLMAECKQLCAVLERETLVLMIKC